jgi:hypothetical protein
MWSDHDFIAKNAGFFTLVRNLLPKYAGFFGVGGFKGAKSAVTRAFLMVEGMPGAPPCGPAGGP